MDGKIFISYRRDDEAFFAEQLYERLKQKYTKERVFYDADNIPAGRNFVRVLQEQIKQCDVLLAIIGREWLDARDEVGTRRLDKADDFVRIEIESALTQNKTIIPVLVGNTRVPRIDTLPESLKPLVHLQAYQFNHGRFIADLKGFESVLDRVIAEIREKKETPSASPEKLEELKELQNWEFIKSSANPDEFRKHLSLYPNGSTARYAKVALENAAWKAMGGQATREQMREFIAEFPDGHYYKKAAQLRDSLLPNFADEAQALEEFLERHAGGGTETPQRNKFVAVRDPPLSPHLALLSLVVGGLGQLVLGQIAKGFIAFGGLLAFGFVGLAIQPQSAAPLWIVLLAQAVLVADGYLVGRALKQGKPVGKFQWFPT